MSHVSGGPVNGPLTWQVEDVFEVAMNRNAISFDPVWRTAAPLTANNLQDIAQRSFGKTDVEGLATTASVDNFRCLYVIRQAKATEESKPPAGRVSVEIVNCCLYEKAKNFMKGHIAASQNTMDKARRPGGFSSFALETDTNIFWVRFNLYISVSWDGVNPTQGMCIWWLNFPQDLSRSPR
ncbi:hypothetical protein AA313_de0201484 [Arthrobotrys entomopaga]|nr:hypothetical protein AA313_de0201484 [Arthrobotrys entomopaga]